MFQDRQKFIAGSVVLALMVTLAGCSGNGPGKTAALPTGSDLKLPSSPVTLNVVDVAGELVTAQPMIEAYQKAHPQYLSKVTFSTGDQSALAGKLKAQEAAGNLQIDMILGGNLGVGPASQQGLLLKLLPDYNSQLGSSVATYLPGAKKFFDLANGYAIPFTFGNYGPLVEYLPTKVQNPPTTAQELLDWAKAHPGQLMYGRPANSTPGAMFVNGLPYILGDSDPSDPVNGWPKTWAYLTELGKYIDYYPSGTGATMKELGQGSRSIILSSAGWYINPRATGQVPKEAQVVALENTTYILDGDYTFVPKGITADKLAVVLDMMKWMLTPKQQANAYDEGYLYPGPAVEGVTIDMASAKSQQTLKDFVPPGYDALLSKFSVIPPLDFKTFAAMADKWDREIGGTKVQK